MALDPAELIPGKIGEAMQFVDRDHIGVTEQVIPVRGSFTVRLWVRWGILYETHIFKTTTSPSQFLLGSTWGAFDPAHLYFGNLQLDAVAALEDGSLSDDDWHHVMAWYDEANGEVGIQADGGEPVLDSFPPETSIVSEPFTFRMNDGGSNHGFGETFDFAYDELAIWTRVLSAEERAADYNGGDGQGWPASRTIPGLAGYWRFETDDVFNALDDPGGVDIPPNLYPSGIRPML